MSKCLKCGDTGITVDGNVCDCGCGIKKQETVIVEIPKNYRLNEFSATLVPVNLPIEYGTSLEEIIDVIKKTGTYTSNLLICSPPNTGKTVFAYTIYKHMYMSRLLAPSIIDLIEAREIIMSNSYYDEEMQNAKSRLISSNIAIIKIPMDLPNKFVETMSTIIERRVRRDGKTIFLSGLSIYDIKNQDKRGIFNNLLGDGSYNSLKVLNFQYNKRTIE